MRPGIFRILLQKTFISFDRAFISFIRWFIRQNRFLILGRFNYGHRSFISFLPYFITDAEAKKSFSEIRVKLCSLFERLYRFFFLVVVKKLLARFERGVCIRIIFDFGRRCVLVG
jgi:hypothetical protein